MSICAFGDRKERRVALSQRSLPVASPTLIPDMLATVQGTQPAGPMDLASVTSFKSGWHRFWLG